MAKIMEIYTEEENLWSMEVGDLVYMGDEENCQNFDNLTNTYTPYMVRWCATVEVEPAPHDWCDDMWEVTKVIEDISSYSEEVEVSSDNLEIGGFAFSDLENPSENTTSILGVEIRTTDIWKKYLVLDILEEVNGGN